MALKPRFFKIAASAAALGALLAACGGNDEPPASSNDGGDNESSSEGWSAGDDVFPIMKDWTGCEVLNDLQPLQEFTGAVAVEGGGLIDAAIGEGIDGEAMTCSGNFELATYDSGEYESSGRATVQMGVVPWENPDIAAENFQERLQMREDSMESGGTELTDVSEGELGGTWDESFYASGDTGVAHRIDAYGRSGQWIVYILLDVTYDPGSADDDPVYPFTTDELNDWIVNDYMPETQADILEKIESEK